MVQNAFYDAIVVDLDLSETKVAELISRGYESPKLDYKSEVDYGSATSRLRLVKHVLAMANTAGGYIVVGVTVDGKRDGLDASQARLLDEATVRSWVLGFTSVPIALSVHNTVNYEGNVFVIIAILPLYDRLAVATGDAQYTDDGKSAFAFRRGDVLVRHGTSSERWNQADADYLIGRARVAQKEAWLKEFASDFRSTLASLLKDLPNASAETRMDGSAFQKPAEEFEQLVLGLLRDHNG